ncbi:MAG: metallopeptidase family protein, partial [Alphaproteobacteria bacterium]
QPSGPDVIFLYRRPILDYWCEGDDSLADIITHVLVHEIGHHFGMSDEAMEILEDAALSQANTLN